MSLNPSDRAAAVLTLSTGEPAGRAAQQANLADWQFHAVASHQGVIAAVGLARQDGMPAVPEHRLALLGNLLDEVALALERARLEREAREFAATRERDRIRSVLHASIGEDLKPRLNAIIAASRALKRAGLSDSDKALVSTVSFEASKLDRYVDNLVDLSPASDRTPIVVGDVTIDLFHRSVQKDGEQVHLTPKEYAVFAELAKQPGRVLTHSQLLRSAWGPAQERQIDYLRVAVSALRQKLECDPARPEIIINEPAVGYRLARPSDVRNVENRR
jgi:DNA-binding response OmpR family regulator